MRRIAPARRARGAAACTVRSAPARQSPRIRAASRRGALLHRSLPARPGISARSQALRVGSSNLAAPPPLLVAPHDRQVLPCGNTRGHLRRTGEDASMTVLTILLLVLASVLALRDWRAGVLTSIFVGFL